METVSVGVEPDAGDAVTVVAAVVASGGNVDDVGPLADVAAGSDGEANGIVEGQVDLSQLGVSDKLEEPEPAAPSRPSIPGLFRVYSI